MRCDATISTYNHSKGWNKWHFPFPSKTTGTSLSEVPVSPVETKYVILGFDKKSFFIIVPKVMGRVGSWVHNFWEYIKIFVNFFSAGKQYKIIKNKIRQKCIYEDEFILTNWLTLWGSITKNMVSTYLMQEIQRPMLTKLHQNFQKQSEFLQNHKNIKQYRSLAH